MSPAPLDPRGRRTRAGRAARRASRVAAGLALAAGVLAGCSAESRKTLGEVAERVLTLQRGTCTDLKATRGTGPFREYAVPPAAMLDLVAAVLRSKVVAVFPETGPMSVIAKERAGKDALDDGYAAPFRTAVIVFVHPVLGDATRSKVEVHAVTRGPFHRGAIDWERDVPPLLDDAVAKRAAPIRPVR